MNQEKEKLPLGLPFTAKIDDKELKTLQAAVSIVEREKEGNLGGNVEGLGCLPGEFSAIQMIEFENLSEKDVPSQLRPTSYERKDEGKKIWWLMFLFDLTLLFAAFYGALMLKLKQFGLI